jgi:aminopeptidase YwaD
LNDRKAGEIKQETLAEVQARLAAHLHAVVRERDPETSPKGHAYVKAYLRRELARYGQVTPHRFSHRGRDHENLILNLPGQRSGGFILVGAHFDAVPGSPGADDNGSALAVLLELARSVADTPARRPIRLVAFDLEEDNQAGSHAYAQHVKWSGEPLSLMISLEMLGYRDAKPGSQRYPPGLSYFYPDRGTARASSCTACAGDASKTCANDGPLTHPAG